MTKISLMKTFGACALALFLTGAKGQDSVMPSGAEMMRAGGQSQWPHVPAPEGTVAVPVRVSKALPADATDLKVCLQAGGRTRTWQVLTRACSDRADYCTVFVAVPVREDMAFIIYDVGKPPFAVAEDDACGEPDFQPTGVLPRTMPSG
jgi:hypothetical protein